QITDDPTTSTTTYEALPPGAECQVTETDTGGATDVSIDPTDGIVTVGDSTEPVAVTIDNTFDLAGLEVSKSVTSDAVDAEGQPIEYGPFQVEVTCTFLGETVYADGYSADDPMAFAITDGETV
ncbi:DUF5979 domain-containing protein, partial [Microbacterium sp. G2-8]|uniref:DUF5979 domain-containing protein n=1 Tax=Microbacterium sp. G2-8 TaxID=2842454 RepID=UPI001C8AD578